MPTFAILLDFDPLVRVGDLSVRIATLVLAVVIVEAITLAARIASTTPVDGGDRGSFALRPPLRLDDLLFIVLGIVPGAVIGGRLDYVLSHFDYYMAHPAAVFDAASGGLGLGLAVVGGVLTGAVVVRLLEAPVRRWAHVAALPTLFALAGGKLTQVISGDGQGVATDVSWATSYVGAGPWGSLAPALPSHPAQAYEGILTAIALVLVGGFLAGGVFARRDGRALALAIGLWALMRFGVAATWRDAPVIGDLNTGQIIALGIVMACGAVLVFGRAKVPDRRMGSSDGSTSDIAWPDPAERPRF